MILSHKGLPGLEVDLRSNHFRYPLSGVLCPPYILG